MNLRHIFAVATSIFILTGLFAGCKPTEKNYREAYQKAVAENDRNVTDFENTIYNRYRAQTRDVVMKIGDDTVKTQLIRVKVTPEGV